MRFLLFVLLILTAGVGVALLAQQEPGYLLLQYGNWTVETTVTLALIVLILAFVLLSLTLRLVRGAIALPGRLRAWRRNRRQLRARRMLARGMVALAEGHWLKAERDLTRHAETGETPLLNYLGAARAAQAMKEEGKRDHYLSLAHRSDAEGELAVGVTQAELQMESGQLEQALATVMHLRTLTPKNTHVLHLLQVLLERLGSWSELLALLPELRKRRVLEDGPAEALEQQAHLALLRQAQAEGGVERLRSLWEQVPRGQRQQVELILAYATGLVSCHAGAEAEEVLREAIRHHWEPELVRLYGLAEGKNPVQQLATAEEWLKRHQRHPVLLLTLGRLAARAQLWGKARAYLEASVGMEARADSYRALGELLERLGEGEAARNCYHKGLALAVGDGRPGPVLPLKRFSLVNRSPLRR